MQGYIYILINSSFPNMLKIGKTTRKPEDRARELSKNTNMPTNFIVAYEEYVDNCDLAETLIHNELSSIGCRINENREFFDLPLKQAIRIVISICSTNLITITRAEELHADNIPAGYELYNLALKYLNPSPDYFHDERKAIEYLNRSVALGCSEASIELAKIAYPGNPREAISHVETAIKLKSTIGYYYLWYFYSQEGKSINHNSEVAFNKFITYANKDKNLINKINFIVNYLQSNKIRLGTKLDYEIDYKGDVQSLTKNNIKASLDFLEEEWLTSIKSINHYIHQWKNLLRNKHFNESVFDSIGLYDVTSDYLNQTEEEVIDFFETINSYLIFFSFINNNFINSFAHQYLSTLLKHKDAYLLTNLCFIDEDLKRLIKQHNTNDTQIVVTNNQKNFTSNSFTFTWKNKK